MKALLGEPLVHFLAIGVALFALSGVFGNAVGSESRRIVVTPPQIEYLATGFARTWQRPPTATELRGLVDDYVREEVLYREAIAMGLDRDDTIIRRRLRQKMEFISEDVASRATPSDAELQAYLDAHLDRYRAEPRLTFRQIYLNPERRGDAVESEARRLLERLAAATDLDVATLGDSLMLPSRFELAPQREVAGQFGGSFADQVFALSPGRWEGPIESGYGWHLVFVSQRVDGALPLLAEVRDAVERDWIAARRRETNDAMYQRLRDGYRVTIEWPAAGGDAPKSRP